ncbi:hypothetical protein FOA52_010317 [Chlamydomonas sp. UWO 241]|nr:hypothetical protein FOA52_010317 [Chlamydomonas sp. UWO 241]
MAGDAVAPGDLLCEVETDKATMGWEAQEEGFIAQILLPDGSKDIPVGTPVMVMVEEADSIAAFKAFTAADAAAAAVQPPAAATHAVADSHAKAESPPKAAASTAAAAAAPPAPATSGARIKASPYAKKVAGEAGVALVGIVGSGPGGRIVAGDVVAAIKAGNAGAPARRADAPHHASATGAAGMPAAMDAMPALAVLPGSTATAAFVDVPHTQMRRVIAQRLLESKQTIPHYYLTVECRVDATMALREQVNAAAAAAAAGGPKVSVNDFVIKAAALALKKVPGVNASWQPDFTRQYSNVDISVAVQTAAGLLTPIVTDADLKGLGAISRDVKALAAKAKDGKLTPAEFIGGTFTISNLGMFGVKQFAAIVNPPQAAILAVGSTDTKVVVSKAGGYESARVMHVTLSCDHRVIDGAMGAEWLQAFKGYLENPYTMLL